MNPPHSTGLRTQTCLDPVKEAAWGARPRTVSQAALLGVRLNDRRPAPICMGGCAAQGMGLGGPSPVAHTPGLGDCPPPPARPSRALACKQGVLGLRGEVGWWGEGSNPTPGPPPGYGPKARSASFGCMTGRVRARVAAGGSRRFGRRWRGRRRRSRQRRGRRRRGGRRCGPAAAVRAAAAWAAAAWAVAARAAVAWAMAVWAAAAAAGGGGGGVGGGVGGVSGGGGVGGGGGKGGDGEAVIERHVRWHFHPHR